MEETELEFDIVKAHRQRTMSRLGVTFIRAAFFFFVLSVISIILVPGSFLIGLLYWLLLLVVAVATIGLVLFDPGFRSQFENAGSIGVEVAQIFLIVSIIAYALAVVFLLLGVLFIRKDKLWSQARKARSRAKTIAIAGAIVLVIVTIIVVTNGGFAV